MISIPHRLNKFIGQFLQIKKGWQNECVSPEKLHENGIETGSGILRPSALREYRTSEVNCAWGMSVWQTTECVTSESTKNISFHRKTVRPMCGSLCRIALLLYLACVYELVFCVSVFVFGLILIWFRCWGAAAGVQLSHSSLSQSIWLRMTLMTFGRTFSWDSL